MPPRRTDAPAKRGYVTRHNSGYRVQATIDKKTVRGPVRATESDANSDLHRVQLLPNGQYISTLAQLRQDQQASVAMPEQNRSELASSAAVSVSSSDASPASSSCAPPGLRHSGDQRSSRRGRVVPHENGFRVQAKIDQKTVNGPCRSTEARSHLKIS